MDLFEEGVSDPQAQPPTQVEQKGQLSHFIHPQIAALIRRNLKITSHTQI